MSELLRVTNLAVRLPTGVRGEIEAVKDVSLSVRRGERVGIVGESGSGKSVTGRSIAGLLPASPRVKVTGSIEFDGQELVGAGPRAWQKIRASKVGMIFQDPLTFLNPVMRIGRQVEESIPAGRARSREVNAEVLEFLSLAGLDNVAGLAQRFPHELSGGMRQRVLIAIAIAKRPELIVADEPTTALDATVQQRVLRTLDETVSELGTSLILISHDLAVVASMTDRIYVMYGGRVVESGPTTDVLNSPQHPYTQVLLRSVRSLTDDGVELYSIPPSFRAWLEDQPSASAFDEEAAWPVNATSGKGGSPDAA
ncbi:ABC transporter ATP-binding protein [Phytoactinopolyspora mesophila]|uniref:ATP-binding cassette domain-containing protein n=1 Tax=Phytoactinopolyspora mesophila TaxID=2650750 RepID=A0A7K3M253_9ACTN|nr:ABC transporter ATP-binding protein [Phytoactinopolyspora mesophila]NDL56508.1 ATP-binding cassette domain-containing protein [Phytoactinopolyspora mesophila]